MNGARPPFSHSGAVRRWLLFLSILISGGNLLIPRLPILLLIVLLSLAVTGFRLASPRRLWPLFALLAVVLLIAFARPGPIDFESLAIRYANFLGAMLLLNVYVLAPAGALSRDLYFILRWMAIQAIATVVLAYTVNFLFITVSFQDVTFQSLLLLFNYHEIIEVSNRFIRPDGFFFEPGVFQLYLNLYLYLAMFVFRRLGHASLAFVAVVCTQSTAGIIICSLLLFVALWQRVASGSPRQKMTALLLALALAPPVAFIGYANVSDKLTGELQGSSWAREYDFYTGLNVISEYPLLGIGFDHGRYLAVSSRVAFADSLLSEEGMEDRASSNGLIYLYYTLGIPLATVFLIGMFRQQLFEHRILIGLLLALSLFSEAIVFTPFIMMIVLSAFVAKPRRARLRPRAAAGLTP